MTDLVRQLRLGGCMAFCLLASHPAQAARVDVSEELQRLMEVHGFEVRGLEQTTDAAGRAEGDALVPRLRLLLEDFDHVILQGQDGGVERVIILGAKVAYVPPPPQVAEPEALEPQEVVAEDAAEAGDPQDAPKAEIVLQTQRAGASHTVTLVLEGDNGKRLKRVLLVDTGADRVVLPSSLITPLGLDPARLRTQSVQTANGAVSAQLGTLSAVWLGESRLAGVEAAFIEDSRLGGNALLGMSVLGRFRMTIDDDLNRLTLDGQ